MTSSPRTELSPVAFAISLGIHAGLLFVIPFQLEQLPLPPLRMDVQLSQLTRPEPEAAQAEVEPQPEVMPELLQPEPVPEKPELQKKMPSPVLTSKKTDDVPIVQDTFEAPQEIKEKAVAEPVEAVAATPAESSPEPVQEQVAIAPAASGISSIEPTTQEATDSEAWDGYGQLLYDIVERNKKYPPMAIRRHLEGRVIVSARISMGKLVDITLVGSSGHRVLDEQALEMVRKAASILPVKNGLAKKSFNVLVPIDFKLQG